MGCRTLFSLCAAFLIALGCATGPGDRDRAEAFRALMQCVRDKDAPRVVQVLQEDSYLARMSDERRQTPLHLVARVFVEEDLAGAKPGEKPRITITLGEADGKATLTVNAAWFIPRVLLNNGAPVNAMDDSRRAPLHYAAERNLPTLVEMLIKGGAHFREKDGEGNSPMALARRAGAAEVVAVLKSYGATD